MRRTSRVPQRVGRGGADLWMARRTCGQFTDAALRRARRVVAEPIASATTAGALRGDRGPCDDASRERSHGVRCAPQRTEVGMAARHGEAPTLESVAARAGVSRATAGRVLAGSPRVSEHARDAVLRAAAELSYVTNRAARSLMTRRSDSIAFVVAEPEERFFADPFFSLVLRGVHAAVAAHDVQLVFAVLTDDAERERFERFARGGHVDGVAFVSLHGDGPAARGELAGRRRAGDAAGPAVRHGARRTGARRVRRRRQPRRRPRGDPPARRGGPHPDRHRHRAARHGRRRRPLRRLPLRARRARPGAGRPSPTPTSPSSAAAGRCATLLDAAPDARRRLRRQRPHGAGCAAGARRAGPAGARRRRAGRVRRHPAGRRGRSPADDRAPAAWPRWAGRWPRRCWRWSTTAPPRPPLVLPTEIVRRVSA